MSITKLDRINEHIPLMKSLVDTDLAIAIWNRSGKVIYFHKADTFPLNFDVGFEMPKGDKIFTAMDTKTVIHNVLPREVFGIAIEGNIVPIVENDEVIGCVTCVFSVEEKLNLIEQTEHMHKQLDLVKVKVDGIIQSASDTTDQVKWISQYTNELQKNIDSASNRLRAIYDNAHRNKILALNANIEAARAGNAGRGFKIIADEMGKLSDASSITAKQVEETLSMLHESIKTISQAIDNLRQYNDEQESIESILNDIKDSIVD